MQIDELTTDRRSTETRDASFISDLRRRLQGIQQDYLFDAAEAEQAYRMERQKLSARRLEARLRGVLPTPPPQKAPEVPSIPLSPTPAASQPDVFDDASDDETSGGLLGLLVEMPETETTAQGTTVLIRDLPLPKHWSGRTSRVLLIETVHKLDRRAIVEFRSISGLSRAKRAAVKVRWDRDEVSEWTMDDVACHDDIQSQHYIATVALHALTFPPVLGFAIGGTAAANNQTSFRALPPIFRDLWGELETKRKMADDTTNRGIWAKLRHILDTKLSQYKVQLPLFIPRIVDLKSAQSCEGTEETIERSRRSQ